MSTDREVTRIVRSWLEEGAMALPDRVLDAVFDQVPATPQRRSLWPSRRSTDMSNISKGLIAAAAVVVVAFVGFYFLPRDSGGPAATPSPAPIGGNVAHQVDKGPATTEVTAVADGAGVSGTAVTTFVRGTHTVGLECAVRDGDTWAFGGTTEQTTVPGERAGLWSAVVVRDGAPQQIAVWLSDDKSEGIDCEGWLGAVGLAGIGAENFNPVESGTLVPPPDLAP